MNKRISLDPDSLAEKNGRYLKVLANSLGHDRGVFVEAHPDDWLSIVRNVLNRIDSPLARGRISEFACRAKAEFLLPTRVGHLADDWESCAQHAMSTGDVALAISDRHGVKYPSISSAVLNAHPALAAQHAIDIQTTPEEYILAFESLVLHSRELHLLDGYAYTLLKDAVLPTFKHFLVLLTAVIARSRKPLRTLFIHCWEAKLNGSNSTAPSFEYMQERIRYLNAELSDLRKQNFKIQLVVRTDDPPHDRYFFGQIGALQIGRGLHLAKPIDTTTITTLPKDLRQSLHTRYLNYFERHVVRST